MNKTEKECKQCKIIKNFSDFRSGRLSAICMACHKENSKNKIEESLSKGIEPTKICTKCNIEKSYLLFYSNACGILCRDSQCIDCTVKRRSTNLKQHILSKECPKCKIIKPIDSFSIDRITKDGHSSTCQTCVLLDRTGPNANKIKIDQKTCTTCKITKPSCDFSKNRWSIDCLSYNCKICVKTYQTSDANKARRRKRETHLRETDPQFKNSQNLKKRIRMAFKQQGIKKSKKTEELLGTTVENAMAYVETLFLPLMSWDNYGRRGWEIDHIIPCSSFDLTRESEQLKCFHYTNLMPRWATTAIAKAHGSNQIGNNNKSAAILTHEEIYRK